MDKEEIEAKMRQMLEEGKIETGLFDTGLCHVVMDVVDGEGGGVTFTWFDDVKTMDEDFFSKKG